MAQWIHFIGGRASTGKLVAVAIGMSDSPEHQLALLAGSQPFKIELLGLEKGTQKRLEDIRTRFQSLSLNGPWYKMGTALEAHVTTLEPVDREAAKPRRVSLDLAADDFLELEMLVSEHGSTTKQRFLRRAYKTYGKLVRYQAQGYDIQALKDGSLVQFPDLDNIPDP